MKRAWWIAGAALLAAAAALAAFLRPRPPEEFPMAGLVPADAVVYAGFPDYRTAEALGRTLGVSLEETLREARPHLAGEAAVYLDREHEWVFLARLRKSSAVFADGVGVEGARVVGSPAALKRWKERAGALSAHPDFQALRSKVFVNLQALELPGRLRDFTAAGLEVTPGDPVGVRGRLAYRPGLFRTYIEHYVQAPGQGAPTAPAPAAASAVEHFPRLWDEYLRDLLPHDRERVERFAGMLSRDFLGGKSVRSFLGRAGPTGGLCLLPTPHGFPAVAGWVDLPDPESRSKLGEVLHFTAKEVEKQARNRGEPAAFELSTEKAVWKIRIPETWAQRLGERFSPAYTFREGRLLFTTCSSVWPEPGAGPGQTHAAVRIDVPAALAFADALAELQTEAEFRPEAERAATGDYHRMFTASALLALQRQTPDRYERAKFLKASRTRLEVDTLRELEKTPRWAAARAEKRKAIDALTAPFRGISRLELDARFTGEGAQVELRAWAR